MKHFSLINFFFSHRHQGGCNNFFSNLVLLSPSSNQMVIRRHLQKREITAGVANNPGDPVIKPRIPFLLNSIFLQLFNRFICKAEQALHVKFYTAFFHWALGQLPHTPIIHLLFGDILESAFILRAPQLLKTVCRVLR